MNFPIINFPKQNTDFACLNNRLALLHKYSDQVDYWRRYWENSEYLSSLISAGKRGNLGEFNHLVNRYINKDQVVLEAGCGPGHLVAGLTANGYKAIGIDYEQEVVKFAQTNLPAENIIQGDILELELADSSIDAYLSVGVVEHFIDSPLPALREARRVLKSDGVALISVPYLNSKREALLAQLDEDQPIPEGYSFHQYYFSINEFTYLLSQAGLQVLETYPYAIQAFLTREHPAFRNFWSASWLPYRIQKLILRFLHKAPNILRYKYAHMVMFVSKPV